MNILYVTQDQYFINSCETHYALHTSADSLSVLHVHDFYELLLVLSGSMNYQLGTEKLSLSEGALLLMRPGDVHCKFYTDSPCQNINLAFPAETIDALFDFLFEDSCKRRLLELPFVPVIQMSQNEKKILQHDLEQMNLLPVHNQALIRTKLRFILVDIFKKYYGPIILNEYGSNDYMSFPLWLRQILQQMNSPRTFSYHLDDWALLAGKSPEYLCRSFQKYLNTTLSAHLNTLHLNYAANLLLHTDSKIIDISYDSGFQSLSYFYHCFRGQFGVSPMKYRKQLSRKQAFL